MIGILERTLELSITSNIFFFSFIHLFHNFMHVCRTVRSGGARLEEPSSEFQRR